MKEVICWSGGADSTLLLYNHALNSSRENSVYAVSIEEHNGIATDLKLKSESVARKNILKYMKAKGFHLKAIKIKYGASDFPDSFNQPLCWLSCVGQVIPNDSNVHFGYTVEDRFWHIRKEFNDAFFTLMSLNTARSDRNVGLVYDFEWTEKKEILKNLKKLGLDKLIWTCERPKKVGVPCGKCDKCKELKEAK